VGGVGGRIADYTAVVDIDRKSGEVYEIVS